MYPDFFSRWSGLKKIVCPFTHTPSRWWWWWWGEANMSLDPPFYWYSMLGSMYVSGKLPTYPFPNLTLRHTSHSGKTTALGRGRWAVPRNKKHTLIHMLLTRISQKIIIPVLQMAFVPEPDVQLVCSYWLEAERWSNLRPFENQAACSVEFFFLLTQHWMVQVITAPSSYSIYTIILYLSIYVKNSLATVYVSTKQ